MTRPFTTTDFAQRMTRAAQQAADADLTGVLVTPGPDLLYFTGYAPIAITERITMLAIQTEREPAMIVPILERSDAELSPAADAIAFSAWTDGDDPYAATAALLDPDGRYAVSDSAWAMHVLGLQGALPRSSYVSMTTALPMLRAVKDADEIERLAAAGARGRRLPRGTRRRALRRAPRDRDRGRSRGAPAQARPLGGRLHRGGLRAKRGQPHHEMGERVIEEGDMVVLDFGGIKDGYGSASMVRSGAWRRRSARSWRRPIEPKVRGANPLGRATRLGRSYAFAGTSLWPRTTRVRRSEARERFWPTSGGFLASSSDDLRARC
jgi:hypothetical protein